MSEILNKSNDAIGYAALDYYNGYKPFEVIERDDGYIYPVPVADFFTPYEEWTKQEKQVIDGIKGRTIDIGCHVGRHSRYLKSKGVDVVGIDISPMVIKLARTLGLDSAYVMSINDVHEEMGMFKNILMMCNNFGLFGDVKEAKERLKRLHRITNPDSTIYAQSTDVSLFREILDKTDVVYHKRNLLKGSVPYVYRTRIRYKRYMTPWYNYTYASLFDMKYILSGTGWRVSNVIESEDTEMYTAILTKA